MDVKDWLKLLTLVGGVVLVGISVTSAAQHMTLLFPLGVGMLTAAGVKSTGVAGLIEKAKSIPPPKGGV